MHSPKKNKNLSSNTQQTEHVQSVSTHYMSYQEIRRGHWQQIKQPLYTLQRIIPLGSTVIITSMLYCIYRLIVLLWG
ncbi:unnamed protein product [Staurois parvus]|uniref:Uncharacterized protein n=1 Tax=Staurois parvus TaxID=386267 RepID=A0ABN9HI96_9NEOB|nr:unnamed protein product [Staurois parvus]